jgi:hypothetical protein
MITHYLKSKLKKLQTQFTPPISGLNKWYGMSVEERIAANNIVLNEKIIQWNGLVNRSKRVKQGDVGSFHVLFPHIPKTGGTTLDYVIAKNYKIEFVYRANANSIEKNLAGLYKKHNVFRVHRVIIGHFEPSDYLYQLLDRKRLVQFVLLRNPLSRVVSYYDYTRSAPNHPKHSLAKKMSLAEFVSSQRIDDVRNGQTYRILGWLKDNYWRHHTYSDDEVLTLAKKQLMQRFSLIGLTEQYEYFLLMAHQLLGWQDIGYQRKNKSNQKTDKSTIDDTTLQLIRDNNSLDFALYEFAEKKLADRYQQLGIDAELVDTFFADNKVYSDLINKIRK